MLKSPWWFLGKGNEVKVARSLHKLGYPPEDIEKRMAAMVLTFQEVYQPRHIPRIGKYCC
jgi:hypothetical protein